MENKEQPKKEPVEIKSSTEAKKIKLPKVKIKIPKMYNLPLKKMLISAIVILFALSLIFNVISLRNGSSGVGAVSENSAADIAQEYISGLLGGQSNVEISDVEDMGGVYQFKVKIDDNPEVSSYITKDGSVLFPSGYVIEETEGTQTITPTTPDVVKSDKPVVELFVMSHCPYGTQAEKGMIPAAKTLGDKIDFNIRFVYYAMHGETEVLEQTNQYCIQKEQNDKYLDYLICFLEDADGERCLDEVGIDMDMLEECVADADAEFSITTNLEDKSSWLSGRFPMFNTDKELNDKYGIGGSPTLVINGAQVQSGRDSASYLSAICAAFNDAPEECNIELSSASPSAGFGYAEGEATAAQCG